MDRPYIICHMTASIDGKVTGDFLSRPEAQEAIEIYYEINRNLKSNGFICGRVTMEESFTHGWYPDLSEYCSDELKTDFIPDEITGFYAVSFDPKGKLGWKSGRIIDEDSGYNNAQIIEVLTKQVDVRYLSYLKKIKIPYIFAGEKDIDVNSALTKLKNYFGADTLLLEGGSIINGSFQKADVIAELSIVTAPLVADSDSKPLFSDSNLSAFKLKEIKSFDCGATWMDYIK